MLATECRRRRMIRSIGIAVIITVCMIWGFSALMNSAIADVIVAGWIIVHDGIIKWFKK